MALTREEVQALRSKYNVGSYTPAGDDFKPTTSIEDFDSMIDEAASSSDLRDGPKVEDEGPGFLGRIGGAEQEEGVEGVAGVAVGFGKKALGSLRGASSLAEKGIKGLGRGATRLFTPKEKEEQTIKALGFAKEDQTAAEKVISEELVTPKGGAEKFGGFVEEVAEFAVPLTKVSKALKGAGFIKKALANIGVSSTVASVQEGEVGKETLVAGATEAALPVVGKALKPVTKLVGRLFKGLGSGLSGASTEVIETIYKNPKSASEVSKAILKEGQEAVLEQNAKTILNGVSAIRQQARKAFGEGLEQLTKVDINPKIFRKSMQGFLDSVGSSVEGTVRKLKNVEFDNPAMLKKASGLIDDLSTTSLDGKSFRSLMNKVSSAKFKTPGTDAQRLSFNAFLNDFEKAIKKGVTDATDKLDDINKAFSKDMSLVEGVEAIFGKVNFKNTKELNSIARKLESLFTKKGLDPKTIDDFLERIKTSPKEFRTSEAVRDISTKVTGANARGLSISEVLQQITSSVITPAMVKNIAIATGLTESVINQVIKNVAPTFRATVIQSLIEANK